MEWELGYGLFLEASVKFLWIVLNTTLQSVCSDISLNLYRVTEVWYLSYNSNWAVFWKPINRGSIPSRGNFFFLCSVSLTVARGPLYIFTNLRTVPVERSHQCWGKLTLSRHLCKQCHQLAGSLCSVVCLSQEEGCLWYCMDICERVDIAVLTLVLGGSKL